VTSLGSSGAGASAHLIGLLCEGSWHHSAWPDELMSTRAVDTRWVLYLCATWEAWELYLVPGNCDGASLVYSLNLCSLTPGHLDSLILGIRSPICQMKKIRFRELKCTCLLH